jgi:hypothetical protein
MRTALPQLKKFAPFVSEELNEAFRCGCWLPDYIKVEGQKLTPQERQVNDAIAEMRRNPVCNPFTLLNPDPHAVAEAMTHVKQMLDPVFKDQQFVEKAANSAQVKQASANALFQKAKINFLGN